MPKEGKDSRYTHKASIQNQLSILFQGARIVNILAKTIQRKTLKASQWPPILGKHFYSHPHSSLLGIYFRLCIFRTCVACKLILSDIKKMFYTVMLWKSSNKIEDNQYPPGHANKCSETRVFPFVYMSSSFQQVKQ